MEGCLLIGGRGPVKRLLGNRLDSCALVVAADSGLAQAEELGLEPTDIVGDFDSVDPALVDRFPSIRRHIHSREKDETDTELGIALLRRLGADTVHIVGGGGGRLDHLFAVHSLFERKEPPDHWYTHREHILIIGSELSMRLPRGKRVSFFPSGGGTCRMRSEGLHWPLDTLRWETGDFGISNRTDTGEVRITMIEGRLIMVYDLEHEDRQ